MTIPDSETLLYFILTFFACIWLLDVFRPRTFGPVLVHVRYFITVGAAMLVILLVTVDAQPVLPTIIIGIVALVPVVWLLWRLLGNRNPYGTVLAPVMFVSAMAVALWEVISTGLLALHNGYPSVLLPVVIAWSAGSWLFVLEPGEHFDRVEISPVIRKRTAIAVVGFIPVLCIMWLGVSQLIVFQASRIAVNDAWCIQETDGRRLQHAIWISPRKMLLQNNYKGTTLAYLLMTPDGQNWSHHWSFAAMNFVPNQTHAFWLNRRSFYRADQTNPPC